MYSKHVVIKNPTGLHARPATQLVLLAERFQSKLEILKGDNIADIKSIFSLLSVGLAEGSRRKSRCGKRVQIYRVVRGVSNEISGNSGG